MCCDMCGVANVKGVQGVGRRLRCRPCLEPRWQQTASNSTPTTPDHSTHMCQAPYASLLGCECQLPRIRVHRPCHLCCEAGAGVGGHTPQQGQLLLLLWEGVGEAGGDDVQGHGVAAPTLALVPVFMVVVVGCCVLNRVCAEGWNKGRGSRWEWWRRMIRRERQADRLLVRCQHTQLRFSEQLGPPPVLLALQLLT